MKKPIVLDCDGVLVEYRDCYPKAWKKAFGTELVAVKPKSYYAHIMYGVDVNNPEIAKPFFDAFDNDANGLWATMEPLEGALEACHMLADMGHELICVTSIPPQFVESRRKNLNNIGFPISQIIATGRIPGENPKLETINGIMPAAFVDDLGSNFIGLDKSIHNALIDGDYDDSPNHQYLNLANSVQFSLLDFAKHWKQIS